MASPAATVASSSFFIAILIFVVHFGKEGRFKVLWEAILVHFAFEFLHVVAKTVSGGFRIEPKQ